MKLETSRLSHAAPASTVPRPGNLLNEADNRGRHNLLPQGFPKRFQRAPRITLPEAGRGKADQRFANIPFPRNGGEEFGGAVVPDAKTRRRQPQGHVQVTSHQAVGPIQPLYGRNPIVSGHRCLRPVERASSERENLFPTLWIVVWHGILTNGRLWLGRLLGLWR